MSKGIAKAFSVALLIVPIGGCDIDAGPRETQAIDASAPLAAEARYQVDPARNRVWLLSHEGVFLFEPSRPGRIALSLPDWVWVGTQYGCLPDLALGPRGEAVITSNIVPTLWRVDPDTLAVSVHRPVLDADDDKDVGFSALVYSREHGAFFAASYSHGSLWKIDPRFESAQKVSLSAPLREACGLALRARGLCARTPHRSWTVELAPHGRSAYIGAASCADRPF